ncbi:hypothetical protein [Evansella sp. LMS18]|nr:hypothetical protein [Evansella sp. LMS18]
MTVQSAKSGIQSAKFDSLWGIGGPINEKQSSINEIDGSINE